MELSDSHKISQEKRDFKISDVLITELSQVQVLPGPPKKHEGFGLRAFLFPIRTYPYTVLHGMSTDAVVSELCERLNGTRLTASTKERTLELFKRYRYQYQFRSINVAQLYGVQKSRASSIIKNLIKHGLVTSPEYGVYQFVKK